MNARRNRSYRIFDLLMIAALLVSGLGWTAVPGKAYSQPAPSGAPANPLNFAPPALVAPPVLLAPPVPLAPPPPAPGGLTAQVDSSLKLDAVISTQPFTIQFSSPMDPSSAKTPLVTYPYLPGKLSWDAKNTQLTFQPDKGFQPGKTYHVYLDGNLKSADGKTFNSIQQWQIQVKPALRLLSYSPASSQMEDRSPVVRMAFSQAVNANSVEKALSVQPAVKYRVQWAGEAAEVTFDEPLDPGAHIRFYLSRDAVDQDGVSLDREYAWDYQIAPVTAQATAKNEREVELFFNYSLSKTGHPFAFDPPLKGRWSWVTSTHAHFVADDLRIPAAHTYKIKVTAPLLDESGKPLPSIDPIPFTPESAIWQVSPSGPDNTPTVRTDIFISFRFDMDQARTQAAFKIEPTVKGKFSWKTNSLTFTPDQPLQYGTQYTVTLDTTARDAAGKPVLSKPYTWSFTTTQSWDGGDRGAVSFGEYGPNAQVVDAESRRALQFTAASGDKILFSLYRIKPEDFMQDFKSRFGSTGPWSGKAVFMAPSELAAMEKTAEWAQDSTGRVQETRIPADTPLGSYVLAARTDSGLANELFILLTNNTLVVKKSDDRIWVWATNINGENVPDLYIRLLMQDGSIMREGKTDEAGVFATTLPKDVAPFMVVASGEGDDITVSGMTYQWLSSNYATDWCCGWSGESSPRSYGAYLFTDRPIYRPGQTVNFKGMFRSDDDARYSLMPEGTQVKVSMLDSRGNVVQTLDLPLNDFGTLNGAFMLADGAMLGDYTVQAEVDKRVFKQTFKVQEYHKPDYQVQLKTDKDFYTNGESVKLNVDVRYFFDQPVAGASLYANLFRLMPSYASGYWWQDIKVDAELPDAASYTWYPMPDNRTEYLTADDDGKQTYSFEISDNFLNTYDYYGSNCRSSWRSTLRECLIGVEVTAIDASNQEVSASKIIKMYSAPEYYTIDAGNWMRKTGESFSVTAQAVGLDGKPVAGRELSVSVKGWDQWNYTRVVTEGTLTTDANGKASLPITIPEEGYYRIQLTQKGESQEDYNAGISDWVYVTSSRPAWTQQSWGDFKITAERTQYKPYETARLVITSSFDGPALLTFERGHVIHTKPVVLTAPLTVVDTQIIPEDAPNIFVKVNAWKEESTVLESHPDEYYYETSRTNSRLYTTSVELQVDARDKQLDVAITPEQPYYEPRQEASFTVKVTDALGQPAEAELSAALVDEAIFSLSSDPSGKIFDAFFGPRSLGVNTYNSMALSRVLMPAGRGGGGGGGDILPANPRSSFPDTAAWIPVIKTDKNGEAKITLTLPDSLTTWRLTVKAITLGTRVGEGTASIVTRKEITLQPSLPSGLTVGDTVDLPVLVRNDSGQARDVQVSFKSDGLSLAGEASQTIHLLPSASRRVVWQVSAKQAGMAQVTIAAAAGETGDAVQLPLEIHERNLPEVVTQSGEFTDEVTTVVVLPETALPGSSVELRLSRSIASDMLGGLDFLTGYPYGCVEQTMSRALPNAVVGRALNQLGMDSPGLQQKLPELINAGLQRLYGYQHDDGGWGWWFDDATDDYQTAWVIFGLSTTAKAGYPVDEKVIQRGAEYLKKAVKSTDKTMDPRLEAYSLYALAYAGYGDREATTAMLEAVYSLDPFSQAALALVLDELGEKDHARTVLEILDSNAVVDADKVYWLTGVEDGHYYTKTMSSGLRSTALALTAYLHINPGSDRIPSIVRYLSSQRRGDGWGSTNETAYTLLALTDYLLANQQSEGEAGYTVLLNDQQVGSGTLQPGQKPVSLALPVDQMKKGPNVLKIQHEGEGRLYYGVTSRVYLDVPKVEPAGTVTVTRAYLDPETGQPVSAVKVGQLVRVRLTVAIPGDYASYLMIEDHLPAGLEALNEKLNITAHDTTKYRYNSEYELESFYFWQDYGYNNKEIRDGRVSFFVTEFGGERQPGNTFEYLARATCSGAFSALPAEATAMYDETLWGRSASDAITIQAK